MDELNLQTITSQIHFIRGKKVILDYDLANLYGVELRVLNQSVKRNSTRFPLDFMFSLDKIEFENLKSQNVISSWGGRRTLPYAFTEQGVAMISGVLRSEKAVQINIIIMRAFVKMRELIDENKDLKAKLDELENKYDKQFQVVFEALRKIIVKENEPRKSIGFKTGNQ